MSNRTRRHARDPGVPDGGRHSHPCDRLRGAVDRCSRGVRSARRSLTSEWPRAPRPVEPPAIRERAFRRAGCRVPPQRSPRSDRTRPFRPIATHPARGEPEDGTLAASVEVRLDRDARSDYDPPGPGRTGGAPTRVRRGPIGPGRPVRLRRTAARGRRGDGTGRVSQDRPPVPGSVRWRDRSTSSRGWGSARRARSAWGGAGGSGRSSTSRAASGCGCARTTGPWSSSAPARGATSSSAC